MSKDETMPCTSRHSSSLECDEVQGMVINAASASGASYDDDEARSMGNSTHGGISFDPSGDMSYIQDPTVVSLSRGNSTATHSKNSSEIGEGQPWRVEFSSAVSMETSRCPKYTRTQPSGSEPVIRTLPTVSVINLHRPIMSRNDCDMFHLRTTLVTCDARIDGVGGCFGLCRAPSSLPWCAHIFVCCAYPQELEDARRDSSYIIIRDNSVEFNNPKVVMGSRPTRCTRSYHPTGASAARTEGRVRIREGTYTGACGCNFHVRDDARVLYFDDPVLHDISAVQESFWGAFWRYLCGGRGQAVRAQSRFCWGWCVRSRGLPCVPVVPSCLVWLCAPCALRYDMPAKDAVDAVARIMRARDEALVKMRLDDDARNAVHCEQARVTGNVPRMPSA